MRLPLLSLVLLVVPSVWGQARLRTVSGEKKAESYIVKMKAEASRTPLITELGGRVGHKYGKQMINGFSAKLDAAALKLVRANPNVEEVYEDGIARVASFVTQTDAPWGLERISHIPKVGPSDPSMLTYNYTRDEAEGAGVDVYVLDTGIYVEHSEFEGRAQWGASFSSGSPAQVDNFGHGTHCAGTVGSRRYGLAKKATLIAVKVLGDNGLGSWADVIAGIDYVIQQKAITGRPSIISMSISGLGYDLVDAAVQRATQAGIHTIVAAGNYGLDIVDFSPGRAPSAITVGATDINDARSPSSNYGTLVDIHAPGISVISTYIGSPTASSTDSGTSMAAPHVAGLAAYIISLQGDMTPAALSDYLKSTAINGVITGIPAGTPNLLAYNGVPV